MLPTTRISNNFFSEKCTCQLLKNDIRTAYNKGLLCLFFSDVGISETLLYSDVITGLCQNPGHSFPQQNGSFHVIPVSSTLLGNQGFSTFFKSRNLWNISIWQNLNVHKCTIFSIFSIKPGLKNTILHTHIHTHKHV